MASVATLGCALVFMAEELLGYQMLGIGTMGEVDSYLVLCLEQAVLACVLAVVAPWIRRDGEHVGAFSLTTVACLVVGLAFALVGLGALGSDGWVLVGFGVMAAGAFASKVLYLLLFSTVSSFWSKRILLGAFMAQSLFAPFASATIEVSLIAATSCAVCATGCLFFCWNRREAAAPPHGSTRLAAGDSFPLALLFGLFVVWTALGFMDPLVLYADISESSFLWLTFLTHFVAAILFGVCVFQFDDASYSIAMRLATTLACASLLVYFAQTDSSLLPRFVCISVTSFLEMFMFFAVADYASYSPMPRLQVFGVYYCVMRAATAVGLLLGVVEEFHQMIGLGIGLVLVVVALWVLTPEALNRFFWGDAAGAAAVALTTDTAAVPVGVEHNVRLVSERYSLTQRESEVLELFAMGRSATFIAEELSLSSNTVRKHVAHIYSKCGVHSKQELLTLVQQCSVSKS